MAVDLIRRAIAVSADDSVYWCNLGLILRRMDRLEEALDCVERAALLAPADLKPMLERGQVLFALRRPIDAIAVFESVVRREPQNALAHLGIAFAALAQGDFERGWAEFEYRWQYADYASQARGFSQPLWDGQSLAGRTILLHAEQGLGDTLQFIRYAPRVHALGGRVVVECQAELRTLLESAPGVDDLVVRGEALPAFDVHAPLMSLPWLFGTRLDTIPSSVPYLEAPVLPAEQAHRLRLEGDLRLKVGLVWAGSAVNQNDHQRSLSLQALEPLGNSADIAFFALQKGPAGAEAVAAPTGLPLTNLGPGLTDFSDTAAVLRQLDLVIAVDTAVAHLAGALGLPAWVLLPFAPDFRWLLERDDSPWYPTVRLFRQHQRTDWAGVIHDVSGALKILAAAHHRSSPPVNVIGTPKPRSSPHCRLTATSAGGCVADTLRASSRHSPMCAW
jgi:tetratricopeptide (TPR) repeat protein